MRKIAIVGLAPSTHDQAPWKGDDYELWGLPFDPAYWCHLDRGFEMHPWNLIFKDDGSVDERSMRPDDYMARLEDIAANGKLYLQDGGKVAGALSYPVETMAKAIHGDYFNSSIAYPLAMAIFERVDHIGIWGVDMDTEFEYAYQRYNCEYLIGLARGCGIDVYIPPESPLCKFDATGIPFGHHKPFYPKRYGYLE